MDQPLSITTLIGAVTTQHHQDRHVSAISSWVLIILVDFIELVGKVRQTRHNWKYLEMHQRVQVSIWKACQASIFPWLVLTTLEPLEFLGAAIESKFYGCPLGWFSVFSMEYWFESNPADKSSQTNKLWQNEALKEPLNKQEETENDTLPLFFPKKVKYFKPPKKAEKCFINILYAIKIARMPKLILWGEKVTELHDRSK